MPKMKTHKGCKKRFRVTAKKKLTFRPRGTSHLNSGKSGDQMRRLRRKTTISGAVWKRMLEALGEL